MPPCGPWSAPGGERETATDVPHAESLYTSQKHTMAMPKSLERKCKKKYVQEIDGLNWICQLILKSTRAGARRFWKMLDRHAL